MVKTLSMTGSQSASPTGGARFLLLQILLVAAWLLAFECARLLEYAPHASLWFPPVAVTFAGFLVFGWRALPGLALACVLATVRADADYELGQTVVRQLANGLGFALVHCLAYGLLAALMRREIQARRATTMPRTITLFLFGGLTAALIAAIGGTIVIWLGGMIPTPDARLIIVPWLIGDFAALLGLGPLTAVVLRAIALRLQIDSLQHIPALGMLAPDRSSAGRYFGKLVSLLGLTALVLFAVAAMPDYPPVQFLLFFALMLQLWIVHTEAPRESLIALAAFSLLVVALASVLSLGEFAFTLQFAVIAVGASTYFGMAVPMLYADNARLRQMLTHDALTGALSRRFFEELVADQLAQTRASGRSASLLMIDLDHLKTTNDSQGHAAGDALLVDFVVACRGELGAGSLVGRLGGDEFGVFLADVDTSAALAAAQRITRAFAASKPVEPATETPRSISIGVASSAANADDYASLMARADQALYAAKRGGRNRAQAA
jgi:diguanylate cyclase (GGDEF)-like protein